MKSLIPLAVASATAFASATGPAAADEMPDAGSLLNVLQRLSGHYSVLVLRSFVDLTYDRLTIEPGTGDLMLTGVTLWPELPWDQDALCEVEVDRLSSGQVLSFDTSQNRIEISGVTIPPACFDPDSAGMMASMGYDGLTVDTVGIDIAYTLPTSAADLSVHATIADAADLSIHATFDYLWFRIPLEGNQDPIPVINLAEAEVSIENTGLWEKVEPMVTATMGDVNAIPPMAGITLGQMLSDGGARQLTPAETAFVDNLSEELARFLTEKNRLVISSAPQDGVWLDKGVFDGPAKIIEALEPVVSGVPSALRAIVPPAEMAAALADGADPDAETRLRIGTALLTGIGAPRSIEAGSTLLLPLARDWDGEAAALIASVAEEAGDPRVGYEMALIALAGGYASAAADADTLEARLGLSDVMAMQTEIFDAWPGGDTVKDTFGQAVADGNVGAIRALAQAAATGRDTVRDYKTAFALATLGAAAGDRPSATLRDRLDRRFRVLDADAWRAIVTEAEADAVAIWTNGFGAALAARSQ